MKILLKSLKIAIVIIGALVGAGFLSGKEISGFFYGQDTLLSSVTVFLIYLLSFIFLLLFDVETNAKSYIVLGVLFYLGNFIIASSMLAAADSLVYMIFPKLHGIPTFSVVTLIVSNIVLLGSVDRLKKLNLVLVPFIIFVIIFAIYLPHEKTIVENGIILPHKIITYCGLNILLTVPLLSRLGRGESKVVCIISALIAAVVITAIIYMFSSVLSGCDIDTLSNDLPTLQILSNRKLLYYCYILVLVFGIITSHTSAYYCVYKLFSNNTAGVIGKIILPSACFLVSKMGFHSIIGNIYPVIGVIGAMSVIIFAVELFFFRKRRPKNTLKQQASTILPYRSLQDRV